MTSRTFAYADPPYLGCAVRYYGDKHPDAAAFDRLETHEALIACLEREFDGWALSCHVPSLGALLQACRPGVRVAAWVKPFAGARPFVRMRFAWEPVIYRTSVRWDDGPQCRDWLMVNGQMGTGRDFAGRKPEAFASWICDLVGFRAGDRMVDLFPGDGGVTRAFAKVGLRSAEQFHLVWPEAA